MMIIPIPGMKNWHTDALTTLQEVLQTDMTEPLCEVKVELFAQLSQTHHVPEWISEGSSKF